MAPRLTTEAALAAARELSHRDPGDDLSAEVRRLLAHKSNHVVAKAAAIAEQRRIVAAVPELLAAFALFMDDPVKRDPGCTAKLAIANTLLAFSEPAWEVYLAGVRHAQLEAAWGPPEDTAATLRAICGRALMALGHRDAFRWHALLLADPIPMTRALAVETLSAVEDERAELLLRAKVARERDPRNPLERDAEAREPERNIEMDALEGLMRIAPDVSFEFIAGFLQRGDLDQLRGAALALAGTHSPEAFEALRQRWSTANDPEVRKALALPIALIRSEEAFRFLLDELSSARAPLAPALMEALALFRESPERSAAVRALVDKRRDRALAQLMQKFFDPAAS